MLALLLLAVPALAEEAAPDATKHFADGQTLLTAGDLPKALEAFVAAAKADPENKEYARQALVVRRVLALRATVAKSEPSETWEKMVISLHSFYLRNGLRDHALTLDREAHAKATSATTAALVAETLLEMDREAEAADLLRALPGGRGEGGRVLRRRGRGPRPPLRRRAAPRAAREEGRGDPDDRPLPGADPGDGPRAAEGSPPVVPGLRVAEGLARAGEGARHEEQVRGRGLRRRLQHLPQARGMRKGRLTRS
jgi:hypothetical protein